MVRRLTTKYHEVSKPWDGMSKRSCDSNIWQASWPYCCRGASQISEGFMRSCDKTSYRLVNTGDSVITSMKYMPAVVTLKSDSMNWQEFNIAWSKFSPVLENPILNASAQFEVVAETYKDQKSDCRMKEGWMRQMDNPFPMFLLNCIDEEGVSNGFGLWYIFSTA